MDKYHLITEPVPHIAEQDVLVVYTREVFLCLCQVYPFTVLLSIYVQYNILNIFAIVYKLNGQIIY